MSKNLTVSEATMIAILTDLYQARIEAGDGPDKALTRTAEHTSMEKALAAQERYVRKMDAGQKEYEALRRAEAEERARAVEWMEGIDSYYGECDLPPAPRDDDDDTVPF